MSDATEEEIKEARKKMAEKFGNTQIGGKGKINKIKECIIIKNANKMHL